MGIVLRGETSLFQMKVKKIRHNRYFLRVKTWEILLSKKNHFATDPTNITCIAVSFSPMTLRKSIAGSMSEANTSSMMRHRQKMASEPALTDLNVFSGVGARLSSSVFASNDIPSDLMKRRLNG